MRVRDVFASCVENPAKRLPAPTNQRSTQQHMRQGGASRHLGQAARSTRRSPNGVKARTAQTDQSNQSHRSNRSGRNAVLGDSCTTMVQVEGTPRGAACVGSVEDRAQDPEAAAAPSPIRPAGRLDTGGLADPFSGVHATPLHPFTTAMCWGRSGARNARRRAMGPTSSAGCATRRESAGPARWPA